MENRFDVLRDTELSIKSRNEKVTIHFKDTGETAYITEQLMKAISVYLHFNGHSPYNFLQSMKEYAIEELEILEKK